MTDAPASDLPNPYTPGQIPRVLAGRSAEFARIRDQLARIVTYGELGGPLLVFHAPRGLGKTSLLRAAQRHAAELGFLSAWVACSRERPFLAELAHAVGRSLQRADAIPSGEAGQRWRSVLERVSLELGVPGLKVRADLAADDSSRTRPPVGAAPIGALEDLLHNAATLVRTHGGAGLLVFVDELHAASGDDMATLLNALQNLDGEREDNPLAVITAGLPVTPEALTRAATFGERSAFVALDVLSPADAATALTAPAEALEVQWTDAAVAEVVGETRGHPYFLQLLGSTSWAAAGPAAGGRIELADVLAGVPAARQQVQSMYGARWRSASRSEQAFLVAMADAGEGNVSRAQIAAGLGQDTRSISAPRERLIGKGVIEPVGHGLVRFTLPGFADFVRDQGR